MLQINRSTTLNGNITVGDNELMQPVVNLNANITENGASNVNINIYDQIAYEANKKTIRKEIAEFQAAVYALEDELTKK